MNDLTVKVSDYFIPVIGFENFRKRNLRVLHKKEKRPPLKNSLIYTSVVTSNVAVIYATVSLIRYGLSKLN